jgi:hypothetical protein
MDHFSVWKKTALAFALVAAMVSTIGCTSAMLTAVYLFKGNDEDAKFAGLKGKKVAVVCRPMVSLQDSGTNVSRELAKQIGALLEEKGSKIKTIDEQKIAKWTDNHQWDEYLEVGRAVKADVVVGVDLESFSLYKAQTLFQGNAKARIMVYDCKNGKTLFEAHVPQCLYPPNSAVETSVQTEPEFRRHFIRVLAERIGENFYPHDRYSNFGQDTTILDN